MSSGYGSSGYGNSSYGNSSYGSNRYGNDTTSSSYGNQPHAYQNNNNYIKDSAHGKGGADAFGKDPHQHWRDQYMQGDERKSPLTSYLIQWPIQMLEAQLQYLASSKADSNDTVNSVMTDTTFRWLGVKNLSTVMISMSSLIFGIIVYVLVSLFMNNLILSYFVLFIFLSHALFPGYIIQRMKKFIAGKNKTGRFAGIIRRSWITFEFIYIAITVSIYLLRDRIDWIGVKVNILTRLSHGLFKRFLYKPISSIPLENMPQILGFLVIAMLAMAILYFLMCYVVSKKAIKEQVFLQDALDKEHLRPAEILKAKAKREIA